MATATVTFMDGAVTLGTGTLNASGQATFATTTLSVGSNTITAVYGGDTQKEGGHESYFTTTLRNVTADGWVVIGILTVMFFGSMVIMVFKALFLNRVAQGNARFLERFYQEADDPAALARRTAKQGDRGEFGLSTLAKLYHQGMEETFKRLEGQTAGADRARILSAQSIEAIRATLDAGLTRRLAATQLHSGNNQKNAGHARHTIGDSK